MADLLGISRSTYCCYEIGRISPDLNTIMKLSKIFDVHYSEFLEFEKNDYFKGGECLRDAGNICETKLQFGSLSDEEKYFVVAFRLLSEDDQKEVMKLILNKFKNRKNKERF